MFSLLLKELIFDFDLQSGGGGGGRRVERVGRVTVNTTFFSPNMTLKECDKRGGGDRGRRLCTTLNA